MHNSLSITLFMAWVKNVYNLRIETGTIGGVLSPIHSPAYQLTPQPADNPQLTHSFIQAFTEWLSTLIFTKLPPLITTYPYYPQHLLLQQPKEN